MRIEECTARAFQHPSGYEMVCLENEAIRVTVIPRKGAEIYCFEDRELAVDVLWKAPWGLRAPLCGVVAGRADSEMGWMDHFSGGWQGIFPNAGTECMYLGAHHSFHGESSLVPWTHAISRTQAGVCLECQTTLARTPFSLVRSFELRGNSPTLYIREKVTNYSACALPFIWGHHPTLGSPFLSRDCLLQVPASGFREGSSLEILPWKSAEPQAIEAPGAGVSRFGYLLNFDAGWYSVCNRKLGLGFALAWPLEMFPCAWLWQEFGGTKTYPWYGSAHVMAVEPFTTASDRGLAQVAEANMARIIRGGESLDVELAAVLYHGDRMISSFSPTGELIPA